MRLGLPSSEMRSATFAAAAEVKIKGDSVAISVAMGSYLMMS
jgi:hypothetical protein